MLHGYPPEKKKTNVEKKLKSQTESQNIKEKKEMKK